MEDFVLLFRQTEREESGISENEKQIIVKKWENWFSGIAAQGRLTNTGIRLSTKGQVLKPGGAITNGPFVEIRELLLGFIIVKAANLEEATTLAHGCPTLELGGCVEIRPFHEIQNKFFL